MKNYIKILTFLLVFSTLSLASCKKEQRNIDNYIEDSGLTFTETDDGIWYVIHDPGETGKPTSTDLIKAHYDGTYTDGVKFDSSIDRNSPLVFYLTDVIEGWQRVIPLLGRGGSGTFVIPSDLAYGSNPPGDIRKNAPLVFDIELIDFAADKPQMDKQEIEKHLLDNALTAESTTKGVYYIIDEPGEADKPDANDRVTVHYEGRYMDGVKFDSSYDRGEPASFDLDNLIEGWRDAIPLLGKGGAGTFFIPSDLAYGPNPQNGIRPHAVLVFDIELLDFLPE